jgi:hypothetical protein
MSVSDLNEHCIAVCCGSGYISRSVAIASDVCLQNKGMPKHNAIMCSIKAIISGVELSVKFIHICSLRIL